MTLDEAKAQYIQASENYAAAVIKWDHKQCAAQGLPLDLTVAGVDAIAKAGS